MKYFVAFVLILTACSKREPASSQDTLLTKPLTLAPAGVYKEDNTGLWIDSSMIRQQPDMKVLKGFDPKRVVEIYLDYRPLRKPSTTPHQIDSFEKAQKISARELHSILAEGDRLGWSRTE